MTNEEMLLMRLLVEHCESCPDQGWYYVGQDVHAYLEQCYFCYTNPNSYFNFKQSIDNDDQLMKVVLHSRNETSIVSYGEHNFYGGTKLSNCVVKINGGASGFAVGTKYEIDQGDKLYIGVMPIECIFDDYYVCVVDAFVDR